MPWSTRQLADLAGVTVKTVRHYHAIGVLDQPERGDNGYKHYDIPHLVRVLQVRRLHALGVPLSRIGEFSRSGEAPTAALQAIDAQSVATIERLRRVQHELALLIRHEGATDLPPGFGPVGRDLSEADRALLSVSSRVLDDEAMDDLRDALRDRPRTAAEDAFDQLPADASERRVSQVAALLTERVAEFRDALPWAGTPVLKATRDLATTGAALLDAVDQLYNGAQREVLRRLGRATRGDDDRARMPVHWSTRELADLAGTTVNSIRHYHSEGLLETPERRTNGYKKYEVKHLTRLLRIRRLAELGMPLDQIAAVGDEAEPPEATLRILETEIQANIARLQLVRDELAHVIRHSAPTDLPPGFSEVAANMSATDRAMLLVYSRIFGQDRMASIRDLLTAPRTPAQIEFAELGEDADVATRARLADELRDDVRRINTQHPWTRDAGVGGTRPAAETRRLLRDAYASLYNSAQRDVLARIRER
jgi:DNA-binding transcriptional MerR regulator